MKPEISKSDSSEDTFLENIVERLPCVIFRCLNNCDWTALFVSQGAYDLTGYIDQELMDEGVPSLRSLVVPEQQAHVWEEIQTAIKQELPFEVTHRLITKTGEEKWVMIRGEANYTAEYCTSPDATIPKLILDGMMFDVTDQKLTELKAQKDSDGLHEIMVESIEGVLIHRNERALFVNKSLINILGYESYDQVLELEKVSALFAPYERYRMDGYIQARMNGEAAPTNYEVDALHRDSSIRHLEVKSSLIYWREKPAILSAYIDRTKLKVAQQNAERQRQEFSHTNRLNMLGEMTASIAHELNQPLTAIVSRCAAAKNRISTDNPDLGKVKQALESIEEQALRSGEIIKQLRAIVKPKTNQYETVNLNDLLDECLNFIKVEGLFFNTRIKTNITPELPLVIADATQVQQVILNLIRNASDAMQGLTNSDRCIKISAIPHDDSAVQISVCDSGKGITDKQEENLFQSFYSTKEDGMGMGLSTSRSIIAAHNGHLWFSHNTEQGVTFRFTLPIDVDQQGVRND
ncbi:PAS domain-containing sensor histidine kinase [Leucothrix arctica]|nr:PAS domain-containing sensor histidine kinase [Leucothrix arctica]